MLTPRPLFVGHTGTMSGAEIVLSEIAAAWAGASAFLFEDGPLRQALERRGIVVEIAGGGATLEGLRRDRPLIGSLGLVGRLVRLIGAVARRARDHDVVYANSQKAFTLSALAMIAARRPLIWHLHDILDERHFAPFQRRLQVVLANRLAARVLVPSTVAAEAFVAAGGRRDRVHVVPNGVAAPPAGPAPSRADLALPAGPLIGVFSRLAPWKGQHVVLRALAELPDVRCIVAGAPLFGEDAYAAELHRLVADLGLGDRVVFLGQRSDVRDLMRVVDAVVHPSVDPEPFGLTLVEAMSVRTPVIASDAGASVDILDGGSAGRLVPAGDAAALAVAVRTVLAGGDAVAATVERAAERAATLYDIERMRAVVAGHIRATVSEVRR